MSNFLYSVLAKSDRKTDDEEQEQSTYIAREVSLRALDVLLMPGDTP